MKREAISCGQLAVRGPVDASGSPGRLALPFEDEAAVAAGISQGWQRAQAGLVEVLRFGAMLIEVRSWIESTVISARNYGGDGKITGRDPGLKGWLEAHCPEINYHTAYGYLTAAEGLRAAAKIAADVPLLAMMGEEPLSEARAEKVRQRIWKAIGTGSLALLRESAPAQGKRGGAREGAKGRRALTPLEHAEAARTELMELLGRMGAYLEGAKPGMLTVDERQWAATRMKDLAAELLKGMRA